METKAPPYELNNGSFLPKSNFHTQNLNFRSRGRRSNLRSMTSMERSWALTRRTTLLKSSTVKSLTVSELWPIFHFHAKHNLIFRFLAEYNGTSHYIY